MFRVSVIETRNQRRLVLEGKLIAPWTAELRSTCERARANLGERELVIEMKHLTAIAQEGENLLFELMNEGVKFRCEGVFTKHVVRQLARRARRNAQEMKK